MIRILTFSRPKQASFYVGYIEENKRYARKWDKTTPTFVANYDTTQTGALVVLVDAPIL